MQRLLPVADPEQWKAAVEQGLRRPRTFLVE